MCLPVFKLQIQHTFHVKKSLIWYDFTSILCTRVPVVVCSIREGLSTQQGSVLVIFSTAELQLSPRCVWRAWYSPLSPAYFLPAGKQTQVCGGRLCLSWKVGQTVGTFLWPCFCKVGKEKEEGETLNHQQFSIELPEAACAQSFLYSPSCQNHYQSVFHESADKELSLLCVFSTAFFPLNLFCYRWSFLLYLP